MTRKHYRFVVAIICCFCLYFVSSDPEGCNDNVCGFNNPHNQRSNTHEPERLIEGDIIPQKSHRDNVHRGRVLSGRSKSALKETSRVWPGGLVPYSLDDRWTMEQREKIHNAMDLIRKVLWDKNCIQFVERTTQADYVHIVYSDVDCGASQVGRQGGRQEITLAERCLKVGTIIHEILHTLAFVHEQSRYDRDDYVDIIYPNIKDAEHKQFEKYRTDYIDHLCLPYDYDSVMHYPQYAFSKNEGYLPTVVAKQQGGNDIGQRERLSEIDSLRLNRLYCYNQKINLTLLGHSPRMISVKQGNDPFRLSVSLFVYPQVDLQVKWYHTYKDVLTGPPVVELKPYDPDYNSVMGSAKYQCKQKHWLSFDRAQQHIAGDYTVTIVARTNLNSRAIKRTFAVHVISPVTVEISYALSEEELYPAPYGTMPSRTYTIRCIAGGVISPSDIKLQHKDCRRSELCTWNGITSPGGYKYATVHSFSTKSGTFQTLIQFNLTVYATGTFQCSAARWNTESVAFYEYEMPGVTKLSEQGTQGALSAGECVNKDLAIVVGCVAIVVILIVLGLLFQQHHQNGYLAGLVDDRDKDIQQAQEQSHKMEMQNVMLSSENERLKHMITRDGSDSAGVHYGSSQESTTMADGNGIERRLVHNSTFCSDRRQAI